MGKPGEKTSEILSNFEEDIRELVIAFQDKHPEIKIQSIVVSNSEPFHIGIRVETGRFRY